ncbi:MAG: UDP-N-acetylmuramate dehydrogenase [Candidatus Omnitrophica bacterium]|nr:UDP-N-acetylmuramate dehydrogenase [Candidatus Omnitrophota bacterium]
MSDEQLHSILSNLKLPVIHHAALKDHTTFQLGGPCKAMITCRNAKEAVSAVTALRTGNVPFLLMGFGSNILASDHGVDRVIIRYSSDTPDISRQHDEILCDAATQLDHLVEYAIKNNFDNMTALSGIPGTVGGAITGNAGAYGKQISNDITSIIVLTPENNVIAVPKDRIRFDYRDSDIKHNGMIILAAIFALPQGDSAAMQKDREEKLKTRESKHGNWKTTPCAGSFFRNVEPTSKAGPRQSAGWFLEEAGAKNITVGNAHPYAHHANIVTRDDGATAQDVYALTRQMANMVKAKFQVDLIREVRLLGKFDGAENCHEQGFW